MTAYECLKNGFEGMQNLNCAEKIIYSANIAYDMGLSKRALKLSAGFGAGLGVGAACGTICGSCMVLSDMFVEDYAHENDKYINKLTAEFIDEVKAKLGSMECEAIKAKFRTPEDGCKYVIEDVAQILDAFIARKKAERGA